MPFLPLYIAQLGVEDVGQVAMWSGMSMGITPALTALLSPLWGRAADRFGRKLMVERAFLSFVVIMPALAFATRAWHVFALRLLQGCFAGYAGLTMAMAAESAPKEQMASAIGTVQVAQRLGPAMGPVIGGTIAAIFGIRNAFFVTAGFYGLAFLLVVFLYEEVELQPGRTAENPSERVAFRTILSFKSFALLMAGIFVLQFADRSLDPILALYVEQRGVTLARVPFTAGLLFSVLACSAAIGHHLCGRLIRRVPARRLILAGAGVAASGIGMLALGGPVWVLAPGILLMGLGGGAAMTASYTAASTGVPAAARATAFGFLTSAWLAGMALSPAVSGFLGAVNIRLVFLVDVIALATLVGVVSRLMLDRRIPS
jgi:MFS transporter, DHA1 family, multidrug resistance protein